MRFVIVGAGGVGGNLGARLAEAGHEIAWLARGGNLAALRDQGLRLRSPLGDVTLGPQHASDDARRLGSPDAVIVTVKLYDLAAVAPSLKSLSKAEALFLPLQNGVEAYAMLAASLPAAAVLKGMVSIKAHLEAPGQVVCKSGFCRIRLGGGNAQALSKSLNMGKGISAEVSDDIEADLWRKFVMLASFSAVSCARRSNIGEVLDSPDAFQLVIDACAEAMAVGLSHGIHFHEDPEELVTSQVRDLPRDGRPSMLEDLEAGRRLELEFLSGAVVRLGGQCGVPTPVHARLFGEIARLEAH